MSRPRGARADEAIERLLADERKETTTMAFDKDWDRTWVRAGEHRCGICRRRLPYTCVRARDVYTSPPSMALASSGVHSLDRTPVVRRWGSGDAP